MAAPAFLSSSRSCPLWWWIPHGSPEWQPPDRAGERLPTAGDVTGPEGGQGRGLALGTGPMVRRTDGTQKHAKGPDGSFLVVDGLTPADVARAEEIAGHPVTLGDGNVWTIPPAAMSTGGCQLPRRRTMNPDGSRGWEVAEEYQELCTLADLIFRARCGEEDATAELTDAQLDRVFFLALAVNYNLTETEIILAGLMTDQALRGVADALLDWPVVVAAMEKKTAEGDEA